MSKPNAIIFSGYGLNCENETKAAFELAGGVADIMHINDLIARPSLLSRYKIAAFPGGFSYGDDTGSGKAYANRLKGHLAGALEKFLARNTLILGICNGFQILTSAGILSGALIANDSARYLCRWVDVEVHGESPWLSGIRSMSLPIAHGEGKFVASEQTLDALEHERAVVLTYVAGDIANHFDLPANPNGALRDIAGITGYNGRVLGLMPHPERALSFFHLPHWTYLKEQYLHDGVPMPNEGPGLQLFRNAVHYFA
jgi:phosphoribosylformylglycinamidine synthase I